MKRLEDFLRPTQEELFRRLCKMYPNKLVNEGAYILVPGEAPVLLLAHLDTVHKSPVRHICKTENGNILMSPQGIGGDDRCGVYALVAARAQAEKKPWLLFTCNEEIGGVGAAAFCKDYRNKKLPEELDKLKMLIEIDRKGRTDAVYYSCDNPDFEGYITSKGFVTEYGSFSDISYVAPELGVAAVNLSSGYYNAHTQHEYINRKHLNATVRKVLEIIADTVNPDTPAYAYIEREYDWDFGRGRGRGYYGPQYDWGPQPKKKKAPAKAGAEGEGDWQDPDLEGVPDEIRHEFEALLELYSADELNAIRAENGDWAIRSLYDSEVSQYYADIPTEDEDGPDIRFRGGQW